MATTGLEVFDRTLHTTNLWLDEINAEIGPDRHLAWHVLGAVLRTIRDEMQVEQSAHFAAQLPLLVRGAYFDQYRPVVQPASARSQEDFIARIQHEMDGSRPVNVQQAAAAVMRTLNRHMTEGQVRKVRDALPKNVRGMWPEPGHPASGDGEPEHAGSDRQKSGQAGKGAEPARSAGQPAPSSGQRTSPPSAPQHAAPPPSAPQHAAPQPSSAPQHASPSSPAAPQPSAPPRAAQQSSARAAPQSPAPHRASHESSAHGEWEDIDVEIEMEEKTTTPIRRSSSGGSAQAPAGAASRPAGVKAAPAGEPATGAPKTKARPKTQ